MPRLRSVVEEMMLRVSVSVLRLDCTVVASPWGVDRLTLIETSVGVSIVLERSTGVNYHAQK